jgi:PAT family beta-lactamase induction signal transducer AmpG
LIHRQAERPWLFGLLIAPSAVLANGVIGGALSYLFRTHGIGSARGAEIIALLNLPQMIYFLWSPVTDFWIRRRSWIMAGSVASAAAMLLAFQQANLAGKLAVWLMFLSACINQLTIASCGGLMGALRSERNRRWASSFYQAGSLAFGACAIFVITMLSARMGVGWLGWIAALMIAVPSVATLAVPEQRAIGNEKLSARFAEIWHEFKTTFLRWEAIPYTFAMTFPMGSGAMVQLLPGLAADYHVGGAQVAWINGLAGAFLTAAGALATTLLPVRLRAPITYLTLCLANEASLAILWLGPLRPEVYLTGTALFLVTTGACYAAFTAVVLEFLGGSGKSGSARYSIINSMGNIPVIYMTLIDGRGYAHWGPRGMPGIDVVLGLIGGSLLLTYFLRRQCSPLPSTSAASGGI